MRSNLNPILNCSGVTILLCWKWRTEINELLHHITELRTSIWPQPLIGLVGHGFECRNRGRDPLSNDVTHDPRRRNWQPPSRRSLSPPQNRAERCQSSSQQPRINIVDLYKLYGAMREVQCESIFQMANELNITMEEGWNAGNECQ